MGHHPISVLPDRLSPHTPRFGLNALYLVVVPVDKGHPGAYMLGIPALRFVEDLADVERRFR